MEQALWLQEEMDSSWVRITGNGRISVLRLTCSAVHHMAGLQRCRILASDNAEDKVDATSGKLTAQFSRKNPDRFNSDTGHGTVDVVCT